MKRIVSLFLSIIILVSTIACVDLSAYAQVDYDKVIDVDVFKAQCVTGAAQVDNNQAAVSTCNDIYNYYVQEGVYSPTQSFLDTCYEDEKLMATYNTFMAYKTISDPGSVLNMPKEKEDYYKSIIIDILYETLNNEDYGITKLIKNKAIKDSNTVLKNICKEVNVVSIAELADTYNLQNSDEVEAFTKIFEKKLTTYHTSKVAGKVTGVVSDFIKYSNDILDLSERISAYAGMLYLDDFASLWLNEMYNSCDSDTDPMLISALASLKEYNTGFGNAFLEGVTEVGFTITKWTVNGLIDTGISALCGSNPVLLAVVAGFKAGNFLSNLFFGGDEIASQLFTMQCIYKVEMLEITVTKRFENNFVNNQTNTNAQCFNYAVDYYFNTITNIDIDCMEKFLDHLYNDGWLKGTLKWAYGATDDYDECIEALEGLKEARKDNYAAMNNIFKALLKCNYPDTYELYFEMDNVVEVTEISFSVPTIFPENKPQDGSNLWVGEFFYLDVQYKPSNTTQKGYTAVSDNPDVLTINDGIMTGVSAGVANVTITSTENPRVSYTTEIKVGEKLDMDDDENPDIEETPAEYFTYIINNDEVTITGLADGYNPSTLNIPSKIENKNVTRIGNDAFEDCKSMTSVTIPNSVISIGYAAFEYCTKLENINISDNVTSIGEYAFYRTGYYDNSDNWSDAVLYIGKYLIKSTETVDSSYEVKDGTLTIADGAFYSCANLSNLIIPDSTISIGKKSIWYCSNLTNLSIPCSTKVSEDGIRCENISNITITKGTGVWAYHKNYNGDQPWNRDGCTVILADGIESIDDQAFMYCHNLIEIAIPNSVTYIGGMAFFDCDNLRKVTFPNNNKIKISNDAFAYCDGLKDITLYSNNIDISNTAFFDCKNIESINISDNVTNINGDFGLDNLQKTNYIGTIEQWAEIEFGYKESNPTYYSKNLYINDELISEIEINNVTKINPYAFINCTNLKKCIIGNNITSMGEASFEGCSSLEEITLPFVGYSATDTISSAYTHFGYIFGFEICYDDDYHYWGYRPNQDYSQRFRYNIPETLKSVTITGGKILPDAFTKCETLINITLPNNITCIENRAFEGCTNLANIIIPDGVTNIGEYAFYDCSSLQSVALPCSVESSWAAFSGCNNVRTVTLTKGTGLMRDNYYSGYSWPWCSSDEFDVYVENGVTNIGGMTFVQGKSLVNIYLSDTVKSINYQAFAGCSNLKEIDLCNVQSIESSAFSGCINLENIRIPDTIKKIYSSAFTNTYYYNNESNWKDGVLYIDDCLIEVRDSASDKYIVNQELKIIAENAFASKDCSIIIGDFECKPVNESAFAITQYRGNTSDLIIPDQFFGYDILNIKKYAFHNCSSLESITIPNSVIEIDTHAFECCSNLTEILVLPKNTSYCSENGVLFNKDKTNLLRYPCAKTDKNYVIPDSVTDISKGAFFDNDKLECLTISKNVKRIALDYSSMWYSLDEGHPGAFYNNTSLKKIIWNAERCYLVSEDEHFDPESSNYDPIYSLCILAEFFPECTEFIVGDEVKYIPCLILANNQNIKSINISDNVANISVGAFYNCTNLKDIHYSGTKTQWSNIIINDGNDILLNSNIHCADGTICKEHNWDDGVVKVIPTCKEKGQLLCTCLNCGATKTEEIPMHHNFIAGICGTCGMLEADCIESKHPYTNDYDNTWIINKPNAKRIAITFSENTKTESCDYIYLYDSDDNQVGKYRGTELAGRRVNVKGDTVKIRLVTDSSVTYYGFSVTNVQVYYEDCTHSETRLRNEKTANCANPGYTGDICCVECDEVIEKGEIIPKTDDHNMQESVVEPTCTEQGYTEYYCCNCDYSYITDYIPATGIHNYVNGFCKECKAKDPDYILPVINSGESQTVEIKNGGDYYYISFTPSTNGTCTFYSTGDYDTYGYLYDANMNELARNDDGDYDQNFFVTYDLQAEETYIFACRMYSSYTTGTFNVILDFDNGEHIHSYVARTVEPTCTEKGYTSYTCECGDSYMDNYVNPIGHSYDSGAVTKSATCTETGIKTYTCTECGETKTEVIDKAQHTYETVITAPTCTETGYTTYTCSCGDSYIEIIPILKHNYVNNVCVVCGKKVDFEYDLIDDETIRITEYTGTETDVIVPSSIGEYIVKEISYNTFDNCDFLKSITFSEGIESVYCDCNNCPNLETVNIPSTVKSFSDTVPFINATSREQGDNYDDYFAEMISGNLKNINVSAENPYFCSVDGVLFTKDMEELLRYPSGKESTIYEIPNTVKTFSSVAFAYSANIEKLIIPASVENIRNEQFGLFKSVKFGAYQNVFEIDTVFQSFEVSIDNFNYCSVDGVLYTKDMSTLIAYPNGKQDKRFVTDSKVNKIGVMSFCYTLLEEISLTNVNSIESQAFLYSTSLKRIELPENCNSIGLVSFGFCSNLTEIIIPDNTFFESTMCEFIGCINLKKAILPSTVENINDQMFMFCKNLMQIYIPSSVISIESNAFGECANLQTVYFGGTEEEWKKITIGKENNESLKNANVIFNSNPSILVDNIDADTLIAAIEKFNELNSADYSETSYNNLKDVVNRNKELLDTAQSQEVIDFAVTEILEAIYDLEPYLNFTVSAENGSYEVACNGSTTSNSKYSLLFATEITLSATANEGYKFAGWYDVTNNLYFSKNAEYTFKITSNTNLKAVFVKEQSATLTFATYSNWVQSTVTKTIDEWNMVTSIDDLLPEVPYKYGYSNGRWVYNNDDVLSKLQAGENVILIPEYDEDDTSLPTPRESEDGVPALDLYYKLDADANVGSFVMAAGIPDDCQIESVGVAFYYKKANEFDPTKFELLINNKMLVSRFNTDEIEDIYIVNMNKLTSTYNWAARGYVTYYDVDGNLKTVYSNQVNIVDREQV